MDAARATDPEARGPGKELRGEVGGRAAIEALEIALEMPRSVEAGIRHFMARMGR